MAIRCRPIEERFFEKIKKTESCWLWNASKNKGGYGQLNDRGKLWTAHRLSWVIHNGPIKKDYFICHKCDNPPCVNPSHLFMGTRSENMKDMIKKGRFLAENMKKNKAKTHCPKGHSYNKINTYICAKGKRSCKVCKLEYNRIYLRIYRLKIKMRNSGLIKK